MDMKKHLPSADLEKLGKILEIKEAYQRGEEIFHWKRVEPE